MVYNMSLSIQVQPIGLYNLGCIYLLEVLQLTMAILHIKTMLEKQAIFNLCFQGFL